jgi:hypothetical protein
VPGVVALLPEALVMTVRAYEAVPPEVRVTVVVAGLRRGLTPPLPPPVTVDLTLTGPKKPLRLPSFTVVVPFVPRRTGLGETGVAEMQ